MEYETAVSQSGTTHYINPRPHFNGGFKVSPHRSQAFCEFHVDMPGQPEANGTICKRCVEEINKLDS